MFNEILWNLTKSLLGLIDSFGDVVFFLLGVSPVKAGGGINNAGGTFNSLFEEILNGRAFAINDSVQYSGPVQAYLIIALFAVIFMGIFVVIGILKAQFAEDGLASLNKLFGKSFVSLIKMFCIPILFWFMLIMTGYIMSFLAVALNGGKMQEMPHIAQLICDSCNTSVRKINFDFPWSDVKIISENFAKFDIWLCILSSCFLFVTLATTALALVKRTVKVFFYFFAAPICLVKTPIDDGKSFETWKDNLISTLLSAAGILIALYVYYGIIPTFIATIDNSDGIINDNGTRALLKILFIIGASAVPATAPMLMAQLISSGAGQSESNDMMHTQQMVGSAIHVGMGMIGGALGGALQSGRQVAGGLGGSFGSGRGGGGTPSGSGEEGGSSFANNGGGAPNSGRSMNAGTAVAAGAATAAAAGTLGKSGGATPDSGKSVNKKNETPSSSSAVGEKSESGTAGSDSSKMVASVPKSDISSGQSLNSKEQKEGAEDGANALKAPKESTPLKKSFNSAASQFGGADKLESQGLKKGESKSYGSIWKDKMKSAWDSGKKNPYAPPKGLFAGVAGLAGRNVGRVVKMAISPMTALLGKGKNAFLNSKKMTMKKDNKEATKAYKQQAKETKYKNEYMTGSSGKSLTKDEGDKKVNEWITQFEDRANKIEGVISKKKLEGDAAKEYRERTLGSHAASVLNKSNIVAKSSNGIGTVTTERLQKFYDNIAKAEGGKKSYVENDTDKKGASK